MQCSDLASLQQSLSPGLQQSLHPGLQPPGPPQMAPAQAQAQVPAHLGPQFLQAGLQMFGRPDLSPHIKQALLSAWQLPPLPSDTPGMAALQPHSSLHSLQGPPTPLAGQVRAGRVPLFPHAGLEAELLQSCGHSAPPYSHSPLADPGPLAPDLLCNTGPLTRALQASELGPTASAAGGLELPVRSAPTSLQSHSATPHTPAHADEAQAPAVGGVPRCEAANTPGQDQATPCTRAQAAAQLPAVSASRSLSTGTFGCRCACCHVGGAGWPCPASSLTVHTNSRLCLRWLARLLAAARAHPRHDCRGRAPAAGSPDPWLTQAVFSGQRWGGHRRGASEHAQVWLCARHLRPSFWGARHASDQLFHLGGDVRHSFPAVQDVQPGSSVPAPQHSPAHN